MGRSDNSRNRIFEKTLDGIRTAAFDPDKVADPDLIIYNPIRAWEGRVIVTNGNQSDTILEHIIKEQDFYSALRTREFEPDAPHYTPRISGLAEPDGSYVLSILKTMEGDPSHCQRCFYEYPKAIPGIGHFISTYETDGDPLPSFSGEPVTVSIEDTYGLNDYAGMIWTALNDDNKVSLYARAQELATGKAKDTIFNKHVLY